MNSNAQVGKCCRILVGVVIGQANDKDSVPVIGDYCYIGSGAKIIGKVKIGDYVNIGANAVVTKDVPDRVTVAGVPAKVISQNDSTCNLSVPLLKSSF